MTAVAGTVELKTLKVGNMDLTNPSHAKNLEVNIWYDILTPLVLADVQVLDENDALGRFKISGKEDVEISWTVPGGSETPSLKLKGFTNTDLDDKTFDSSGSMSHKEYNLRFVSKELLMNRSERIQESFDEPTHSIVQKVMKKISDKQVDTPDQTKAKQTIRANYETAFGFLENIRDKHVSQKYNGSAYILFPTYEGGTEKYKFCTFEYLMDQGSKFEYKQENTGGSKTSTDGDTVNRLIWVKVPQSFHTPSRYDSGSNRSTYNLNTGVSQSDKNNKNDKKVILGQETTSGQEKSEIDGATNKPLRHSIVDNHNNKQKTYTEDAKVQRAKFLADLSQNTIKFEIYGNPALKIGDVVTLKIPKKADAEQESGETQMNDKVLIVRLRHRIRGVGTSPQYTMVAEAIKAAYRDGV